MDPNSLNKSQAVLVKPMGCVAISQGDTILVCVKCKLTDSGEIKPINPNLNNAVLSLIGEHGNNVFFIKRSINETDIATNG